MFLGSMDNEHSTGGLVPLNTNVALDVASKMKVNYIVESTDGKTKATPKTAKDNRRVYVEESNVILDSMFKNPADAKAYYADPQKLLSTFIGKWQVNDANGQPVPVAQGTQQAFTAIGVDMLKNASHSDMLNKLLQDSTVKKNLTDVTVMLKKEGVLTPDEEKAGS
jgi:hypothetical protein